MSEKPEHRVYLPGKGLHHLTSLKTLILIIILLIFMLNGCTFFSPRREPLFLTRDDVDQAIQTLEIQEDIVTQFYSHGTLSIDGWIVDTSVNIDIFCKKDPLTIKMEIYHSWGPLYDFLIKEDRLEVLDFREKKQYTGKITPDNLARFLPGMECPPDMIWSFLRGYPHFSSYDRVYESAPGVLTIEDQEKNSLGTITFYQNYGIKEALSTPPRFLKMKFTGFQKAGEIEYAEKTVLEDVEGKKDLTIKRKKTVFTRDIPDAIFKLTNQPDFEAVDLDN